VDDAGNRDDGMYPHATPNTASGTKGSLSFPACKLCLKNFYTARIDHKLGQTIVYSGRTCFDDTNFLQPDRFDKPFPQFHTRGERPSCLRKAQTFGPSLVNAHASVTASLTYST